MSIGLTSFKHPKLPISIKIPDTLLQIVYICMTAISPNLSFANLLVAWLYILIFVDQKFDIFVKIAKMNDSSCSV